jgi:AraC-like DNA-binding protein
MPPFDALHADVALRGLVAGLLLFHAVHLGLPGPRPGARLALIAFVGSVFAYLFCQRPVVLLALPRPLAYALLLGCVGGAGWLWLAARALFNDAFCWSWPVRLALLALLGLGLAANVPYFPEGDGPFRRFEADSAVVWLGRLHASAMLGFSAAALWEVARGWRDDLVASRRFTRRWVALGIGLYSGLALVVELAVQGREVGPWLPTLHVLGIGTIALALAVFMARHSLAAVLGSDGPTDTPPETTLLPDAPEPAEVADPSPAVSHPPVPDKEARCLERLNQALVVDHVYRREGLTLADLAQTLGLAEAPLRSLINQRLGFRNFNDFLHHHRLQEAMDRLGREDLPILSIALECGYGSIGPFNRAFKQRTGLTPTEFRARARLLRVAPGV